MTMPYDPRDAEPDDRIPACRHCNGRGKIEVDYRYIVCPVCSGAGEDREEAYDIEVPEDDQ
jgi:RecJ-like exonuclease